MFSKKQQISAAEVKFVLAREQVHLVLPFSASLASF